MAKILLIFFIYLLYRNFKDTIGRTTKTFLGEVNGKTIQIKGAQYNG